VLKKYFLQILIFILLLGIAWALFLLREPVTPETKIENTNQANVSQLEGDLNVKNISSDYFPIRNWMIDDPELSAKAAIAIDLNSQQQKNNILYQKNPNQKMPIASLTKIMTAIIAMENLNLEEVIKISKNSVFTDGNNGGLIIEEELTLKNLLYIMLVESSNDAAMAVASDNGQIQYASFIALMNEKAKELGLNNTYFADSSGLSEENQSTAMEVANLVKYALNMPLLSEMLKTPKTTISSLDNKFVHNLINTNKLLGKIPIILGGKTGFTEEAGGCMLTFSNINNNYLITVVLGSKNREDDTEKLINWAQAAWIWN
jgi:serine-type D-Ala-D-Ala carboxypeptidase (penicillin-binding protein 5/6)